MPTLKSVKLLCYRVLRGAPQTLRLRYRLPSSSPEPFSILVFSSVHRSRLRYRPPSSFPKPSSVPSPSFVLHPRLRNCSPSSFSALFTGFVTGTFSIQSPSFVLPPRLRNCPPSSFSALFTGFVTGTFSIQSPSFVLPPRLRNRPPSRLRYRPPSSSPSPSSILVFSRPVFWDITKKCAKNRYL